MKKLITLMLAVCLVFAMVGIYASAETLDGVEDLATYTVPDSTKYGQSWYIDAEGEYKLFDGVIPDTNTLDAARDEAMKEDPDIKDWYAWDGWIALARSIAGDAYELNKSVNIDSAIRQSIGFMSARTARLTANRLSLRLRAAAKPMSPSWSKRG